MRPDSKNQLEISVVQTVSRHLPDTHIALYPRLVEWTDLSPANGVKDCSL